MDAVFDICYLAADGNSAEPDDIPKTKENVWVLGKKYSAVQELDRIRRDITSIIWCTYRKGFVPIGDEGLWTSDKGWGCMLRCGQMVLGVALTRIHLSEDWTWTPETRDPTYLKIIQRFEERKQAPYSIHQVALMGASEGKEVGQWFGPNTVAQVLRKLVAYDKWSSLVIHVALDNTVVKEDILKQCVKTNDRGDSSSAPDTVVTDWMPLLLIVPLRLGLSEINPVYIDGLKTCFQSSQSIGVIGGKPNQALYLIGCVEDEVIYLDPHTTQRSGLVENKLTDEQKEMDCTYHCKYASRIPILAMDPSVAVCFLCRTRSDFEELCATIESSVMQESQALFEICERRPAHWGPLHHDLDLQHNLFTEFEEVDRQFDDSDEEFEIL